MAGVTPSGASALAGTSPTAAPAGELERVSRLLVAVRALAAVQPEPPAVLRLLAEQALAVTDGAAATVARCDTVGLVLAAEAGVGAPGTGPLVPALTARVAHSGQPALEGATVDGAAGPRPAAAAPLRGAGGVVAVLTVTGGAAVGLDERDLDAVAVLADAAASRLAVADALAEARAAGERLRRAMDCAQQGHTVYDPVLDPEGRLVDLCGAYVNPMGAALRALDPSGWVGSSLLEAARREGNLPLAHTYLQVGRTGEAWEGRPQVTTRRGRRAFALSVVAMGPPPSGVLVSFRDVEDEARAADQLASTARMLDETQALAGIGSWELDLVEHTGRWSAGLSRLCGLDPADGAPAEATFLRLVHPEDRDTYRRQLHAGLRTGGRHVLEYRIVTPEGQVRHIAAWAHVEMGRRGRAVHAWGGAQDVTERVLREHTLAASREQLRLSLALSPIGLARTGLDGRWLEVNQALADIVGRPVGWLVGRTSLEVTHPEDRERHRGPLAELIAGHRESYQLDQRYLHADGHTVWISLHAALVRNPDGTPRDLVVQVIDISGRHATAESLAREAGTDPLTGLANRRAWERFLAGVLRTVLDGDAILTVGILDLDRFKAYNDALGHPAGDALLREAADAWTAHLSSAAPAGLIARLGGEEFAVALPGTPFEAAQALLRELCALVPAGQTASAGVTAAGPGDDARSLMTRADAALYVAKRSGRARVEALRGS